MSEQRNGDRIWDILALSVLWYAFPLWKRMTQRRGRP